MAPIPVYTSGDKVYTFNGTSDFDKVDNSDAINFASNQDFTVAVWIKAESQQKYTGNQDNCIVEKMDDNGGGYPYVIRYLNQTAGHNYGKVRAARFDEINNPGVISISNINDGRFHHVAFVRSTENNQGKLSLYINGKLESSCKDTTTGNTKNNSSVYLGRRGVEGVNINWFTGSIKGLSIYNVALSSEQIQEMINSTAQLMPESAIQPNTNATRSQKRIKIELIDVYCADTEDVTGADDFFLVGALVGGGQTKAILTRPIKINDKQRKSFRPEECVLFDGDIPEGQSIKGGLKAYDEDAGKDWSRYGDTVKQIASAVSSALAGAGSEGAIAGKVLSVATSGVGLLASLDKDDLLGATELEISATGPAYEVREWKMSQKNSFAGWSSWDYTLCYRISRS